MNSGYAILYSANSRTLKEHLKIKKYIKLDIRYKHVLIANFSFLSRCAHFSFKVMATVKVQGNVDAPIIFRLGIASLNYCNVKYLFVYGELYIP